MGGSQSREDVKEEEDLETELRIEVDGEAIKMTEGFVKHIVKKTGLVTEEKEEEKKEEEEERYLQPVESEELKRLKNITSTEIEKTASDIGSLLASRVPQMVPICEDARNEVEDCYSKYPQKPLMCHSVVEEYKQCVRKARGTSLDVSS